MKLGDEDVSKRMKIAQESSKSWNEQKPSWIALEPACKICTKYNGKKPQKEWFQQYGSIFGMIIFDRKHHKCTLCRLNEEQKTNGKQLLIEREIEELTIEQHSF